MGYHMASNGVEGRRRMGVGVKVGDLVQYVRPNVEKDIGVIVTLRHIGDRVVADVLWDNGIWADDAYEFKVIS